MKLISRILGIGLLLLILSSQSSVANNKVGNGGDVIVCDLQEKKTVTLLDFEEGSVQLESQKKDPYLIAKKVFENLRTVAPQLSEQYLKRLSDLPGEIDFRTDVTLVDVKDSLHTSVRAGCSLQQIAIRKSLVSGIENRFLIQKDLWDQLPPLHQAGLLSHEIIYEHFAKLGETDSRKARLINRLIFVEPLKKEDFWKTLKDLELPIYP